MGNSSNTQNIPAQSPSKPPPPYESLNRPSGTQASACNWILIDTVSVTVQDRKRELSAWRSICKDADGNPGRMDFAYGYMHPEYYFSCDLNKRRRPPRFEEVIGDDHQRILKSYLKHQRRWSCTCALADHVIQNRNLGSRSVRGPTKELDDLGLKHFLLHQKGDCRKKPRKELSLIKDFWYNGLLDDDPGTTACFHSSVCRCNCFGTWRWFRT